MWLLMRNLKEYVKKGLDNIIEITKETSSEYDKKDHEESSSHVFE
jgi:hypothetical protein